MILLNDKEIDKLTEEWLESDEDFDWAIMLCKEQLKGVVRWMEDDEFNLSPENLSGARLIPFFAVEALKKEINGT